jgi:hypothetical protein
MKSTNNPILVTGSHRSGSTWAGDVLAQATNVRYIQEPFNVQMRPKHNPISYMYEHVGKACEPTIHQTVREYLQSFLHSSFSKGMYDLVRWQKTKEISYYLQDALDQPVSYRTLYKDPLAIMSAEWIASEFQADVVMLIRHPAAFVASIKVLNWEFDFQHILKQEKFLEKCLSPFKEKIQTYSFIKQDIVDQGILLWNMIYYMVHQYQEKYGDTWYFVRHEDLSNNPTLEFQKIFSFLDLEFTESIRNYIVKSSDGSHLNGIKRDSKKNIKTWKQRLTAEEIDRIKIGTKEVAQHFYSSEDWE